MPKKNNKVSNNVVVDDDDKADGKATKVGDDSAGAHGVDVDKVASLDNDKQLATASEKVVEGASKDKSSAENNPSPSSDDADDANIMMSSNKDTENNPTCCNNKNKKYDSSNVKDIAAKGGDQDNGSSPKNTDTDTSDADDKKKDAKHNSEAKVGNDSAGDITTNKQLPMKSVDNTSPSISSKEKQPYTISNPNPTSSNPSAQTTTHQYQSFTDLDDDTGGYTDANDTLLTMSFNQDGGCLAVGTGSGFRICNVNPFEENLRRTLGDDGSGGAGIAHIEMLYRTNLLAITGHSNSPQFPPNKVFVYDDHSSRKVGELTFRQKVLRTKLRRDRIVVVLRDKIYVYNFADLALLDKVYTGDNPLGLVGISIDNGGVGGSTTGSVERAEDVLGSASQQQRNNGMVLACPSKTKGQVRVELYGLRRQTFVDAHESELGALALSIDGSLLATASVRGTVIRLFDTRGVTIGGGSGSSGGARRNTTSLSSSIPLREFRRGVERATISCLTFSLDSTWLSCASDHGTVHIFQINDPNNNGNSTAEKKTRSTSMTGKAIRMLPKLVTAPKKIIGMDGVHSYAQVRGVPHPRACAFVPDREQTISVAGMDEYGNGCLLLAEFGKCRSNSGRSGSGGDVSVGDSKAEDTEARRIGYHRFFKSKSPASQTGRSRTKSKDYKLSDDIVEGGAYIDDTGIDMRTEHIKISDEIEDDFCTIDYNMK